MDDSSVIHFVHTLSGQFSNRDQAQSDPVKYAHINIFFRPFPWDVFQGPWFYSEQSYDHDPWRPYRQGVHQLVFHDNLILMLNFGLIHPLRCAGGGSRPELLNHLGREDLLPRLGCAMEFRLKDNGSYGGCVEPGCRCLVPRDGQLTYLVSEVELSESHWLSLDRGFDPGTHAYRWGSEHGPLRFTKLVNYGNHLSISWLRNPSQIPIDSA